MNCKICGAEIEEDRYIKSCTDELVSRQLCFTCNHWHNEHEADMNDPDRVNHGYAICKGVHYFLGPHTDSQFKGFGGHKVTVRFFDGVIKECDNLWCQGTITDAHPHWRNLMPDNAEIQW